MKFLRKLLFPLSLLYGGVAAVRNVLYKREMLRSYAFNFPVIVVGNLSTGGTGKTPHTEYLVRLLKERYRVAILSRGYKRKSTGFVLAGADSNAAQLGDEPMQYHSKFRDVSVAVDANRKNGIDRLDQMVKPDVIVLDDAYQHRRVRAGFNILLTAYGDLFTDDLVLPAGNLREFASGAKRADIIIVTKCPTDLPIGKQEKIRARIRPAASQKLYFTSVGYDANAYSASAEIPVRELRKESKILVAGIAKPEPFFRYLQNDGDIVKRYPDHHEFTSKEIEELTKQSVNKLIVCTEKDYMRLKGKLPQEKLFYLPITINFLSGGDEFDKTILDY
ncbi:tetraacyldisaccharide 4'-kinase, partial [Nostoc linckia z16]